MTAAQYRAAIKKLGLSQRAAAKFFGVNERTSRRWAENGPPDYVEKLLKIYADPNYPKFREDLLRRYRQEWLGQKA